MSWIFKRRKIEDKIQSLPAVIYKYRNWDSENHRDLLYRNEVFMSLFSDFNDPFDCKICVNHLLLDTAAKKQRFLENSLVEHQEYLLDTFKDIEIGKKLLENNLKDLQQYQNSAEISNDGFMEHFGIASFSSKWDSILMWSHYSNYHKGFCVGLHEDKMRNSQQFGKGANVVYTKDFPLLDPLLNSEDDIHKMRPFFKSSEWAYEHEYRLINIYYPYKPSSQQRVVSINNDCFKEVIVGLKISSEAKAQILDICKLKNIDVYEVERVPFKFELRRKLIYSAVRGDI